MACIYFATVTDSLTETPNVDNDIPAVRKVRIELVAIPWFPLTTLIAILLISFWLA